MLYPVRNHACLKYSFADSGIQTLSTVYILNNSICGNSPDRWSYDVEVRKTWQDNSFSVHDYFCYIFAFNIGTLKAIPILNQYKSAREICDKANSVMKPGEKLAMYDFFGDPYLFYTKRNYIEVIRSLNDLKQFLSSTERVFLFIQEKDFKGVSQLLEVPIFVLEKDSCRSSGYPFCFKQGHVINFSP